MHNLLSTLAFFLAGSLTIQGQGSAAKKVVPHSGNPSSMSLKSVVGRHLYVCQGSKDRANGDGYRYLNGERSINGTVFARGQKLIIAAVDIKPRPSESCASCITVLVTLKNEDDGTAVEYPVIDDKKSVTPASVYRTLSEMDDFSIHPLGIDVGSPEHDVYCSYGSPTHMNDDVYMLQIVYDWGLYVYVDNRTGKVFNIQHSY